MATLCLPACGWFGSHRQPLADPTELVVTGAAAGSTVFVDGVANGQSVAPNDHARVIRVSPGSHTVEVHLGDSIVYREQTDVARGQHRVITVLSGSNRA
jgi:hypothetical protein